MYTKEQLSKYPYFERELEETQLDFILDSLTGVVSRSYFCEYVESLIAEEIPFTISILDLDNFKFINDTYGHHAGDGVLINMADALIRYLEGIGIIGRFGGDEFLFVALNVRTYQEKKIFFEDFYENSRILRRNIPLEESNPFVTGTIGCATYPDDAKDYDSLFALIDKALYRGKTKGRNCYIIYVEEKHKNIEIRRIARHGIYTSMHSLIRQFELVPGLMNKLQSVLPLFMEELQISDIYYVGKKGIMRAVRDTAVSENVHDIVNLVTDELYSANAIEPIAGVSPVFFEVLNQRKVETLLIVRIGMDMDIYGYLMCAEPRSRRIWQEDECALFYFLAKMIAARIQIDNEALPEL